MALPPAAVRIRDDGQWDGVPLAPILRGWSGAAGTSACAGSQHSQREGMEGSSPKRARGDGRSEGYQVKLHRGRGLPPQEGAEGTLLSSHG